jgi:hypothetical protein
MACCEVRIGESLGVFPEDISEGALRLRRQVIRVKDFSGKYAARHAPSSTGRKASGAISRLPGS